MNLCMVYLYLQYEELWKVTAIRKDGKKVNVLYVVDGNDQGSVIVVDHSRNFKDIYSMVITMEK